MYDKSKKTWSQRLKIHKSENPSVTANDTYSSYSNSPPAQIIDSLSLSPLSPTTPLLSSSNAGNNANLRLALPASHYQINPTTVMHLQSALPLNYNHPGDVMAATYDYMTGGRSMKYAEPWIYGTVRGIPARPTGLYHPAAYAAAYGNHPHAAAIFAAPTEAAVAVVLCSCPEYLSGTKGRTLKKASVCKKCKGTRLPLANIGGTVRVAGNLPAAKHRPMGNSATVRVVSSTKKQRPTILDPQKDPYDLMRRTRLLSPEPGGMPKVSNAPSKDKSRNRGKSASPVRGRSRTRHHQKGFHNATAETAKVLEAVDDSWLTESEDLAQTASTSHGRKSILRCNVNPYDLISINAQNSSTVSGETFNQNQSTRPATTEGSKKSMRRQKLQFSQNEFMPPNDDFNVQDAALTEDETPFSRQAKQRLDSTKKELSRPREETTVKAQIIPQQNKSKKPNYSNVQAIAGQRISLGEEPHSSKSLIQKSADGTGSYESFTVEQECKKPREEIKEKPNKSNRPDSLQVNVSQSVVEPKRPPRNTKQQQQQLISGDSIIDSPVKIQRQTEEEEKTVTVTVTPTYNIKSILKRPSSKSSDSGDNSQSDGHSKASTPSTPKLKDNETKTPTPTGGRKHQVTVSSPTTTSQFYIPMPQTRKKVQFKDADKINDICEAEENVEIIERELGDSDDSDVSGDVEPADIATNYEYYIRKRNQRKLHKDPEVDAENFDEVITYDEQFIQAMLLEKLQLDSELVSRKQQQEEMQRLEQNTTTLHIKEENEKAEEEEEEEEGEAAAKHFKNKESKNENYNSTYLPELSNETFEENTNFKIKRTNSKKNVNDLISTGASTTTIALSVNDMKGKIVDSQDGENLSAKDKNCILARNENSDNIHANDLNNDNDEADDADDADNDDNNDDDGVTHDVTSLDGDNINDGSNDGHGNEEDVCNVFDVMHSSPSAIDAVQVKHAGEKRHDIQGYLSVSSSAGKAQQYGATKSTTSTIVNAISSGVYNDQIGDDSASGSSGVDDGGGDDYNDDDAVGGGGGIEAPGNGSSSTNICGPKVQDDVKSKQQQKQNHQHLQQQEHKEQQEQQQQPPQLQQTESQKCNKKKMKKDMQTLPTALGTTDSIRPSTKGYAASATATATAMGNGSRKPTKETQSRNPIRRSQSERQQPTSVTYHQSNKQKKKNTNSNSNSNNNLKSDAGGKNDNDGNDDVNDGNGVNRAVLGSNTNIKLNIGSHGFKDTLAIPAARNKINDSNGNNAELNFHDTMALRKRGNRNDTRDLFTMAPLERPRDPPPPPPPPPTPQQAALCSMHPSAMKDGDIVNALALKASTAAAHLEKPSEVITAEADVIESRQQTVNGLENKTRTIGQGNTGSGSGSLCSITSQDKPNQQQQMREQQHQQIELNKKPHHHTITQTQVTSKADIHVISVDKTVTKDASTRPQQQRTVVRVAPFNKNPNNIEVHRLKITHTDSGNDLISTATSPRTPTTQGLMQSSHYSVTDLSTLNNFTPEYGQQKTSILINGDDCYSTMNLSCDDSATPHYHSSVVVTDGPSKDVEGVRMTNSFNTVTINVSSPRSSEDELIQQHNQLNNLLKRQAKFPSSAGSIRAIIPIRGTIDVNLQRSASSTSSASTSSMTSTCSSTSSSTGCTSKRGKTLIRLDYDNEKKANVETSAVGDSPKSPQESEWLPHETELLKILRNPVEAVKRNLVPHICKLREDDTLKDAQRSRKMKEGLKELPGEIKESVSTPLRSPAAGKSMEANSFIGKLLEDPMLNQVAEGLESDIVADLIENSLKRLQGSRSGLDMSGTKDNDDMSRLIDLALKRIQEERYPNKDISESPALESSNTNGNHLAIPNTAGKDEERLSNRGSISSANSFASAHNYELFDFEANESDCYQSCSSDINSLLDDDVGSSETKSKFYQMLVDATLQEIELSTNTEDLNAEEHQYESIRHNIDPIYEEISDVPPPLPLTAPPLNDPELDKKSARSIFEGASKYDILSYLVDAKERGVVKEESFEAFPLNSSNPIIIEEESADTLSDLGKLSKLKRLDTISSRSSIVSDSSEDNQSTMSSLSPPPATANNFMLLRSKQAAYEIERNDSGVGSETSKTSRSKFLNPSHNSSITSSFSSTTSCSPHSAQPRNSPLHLCEDCDGAVETQLGEDGIMFAPLVCRKCGKKRVERKEIITEIVETEEKYGRDLQIILEEFCHPMLVAGLLTQEQLSAIFLNTEELLENNQTLAERMRDALDIALEQGDDDLLTVNIGKIFLESTQMLHAFESYCVRQAGASLLLANLEKDKELLRIFLKVSQMENAVLRRMNLNSFLMVPVQRVTKYPLLLARLYKVTPSHLDGRDLLKQAQEKIELHLNHINQEAKDVPTKLWRRISSSSPNRRASCEIDMINIKLRKMAIDVLEWNHDEVRFVMEGKLLYTQPTDSNWKKARTIKLTSVNALLVTNGKPSTNYKAEKLMSDKLNFPKHTGIREASLLVVKEKCGRYALIREPLYLDRCVVCSEADWDEYFEIQEISSKDTFIFKAEDNVRTKQWYTQLQYHAQGMGAWRKRRNALANIMINGMLTRS